MSYKFNPFTGTLDLSDSKKVKVSSNDTTEGYLEDKLTSQTYSGINVSTLFDGSNESVYIELDVDRLDTALGLEAADEIAIYDDSLTGTVKTTLGALSTFIGGGGGGADEKVKISANDTTEKYLEDAVVVSSGANTTDILEVSTLNDTGDEDLQIQVDETKIDHDALLNFVADEHIDWKSTTENLSTTGTISGSNLSGTNTGDQDLSGLEATLPITTRGDIVIRDAANATARLGVGAATQILTTDGTDVTWEDAPTGVTDHTALTNIGTNTHAQIDTHISATNDHIDHTTVDIDTASNSGLAGGGDISSTRSIELDVNNLPIAPALASTDVLAMYDTSGATTSKIPMSTISTFVEGEIDFSTYVVGPISASDNKTVFYDGSTGKLIKYLSTNNYGDSTGRHYSYAFRATTNGTASTPAFSRSTDTNTGMYFRTSDTVGISTGGAARIDINSSGLSIATTSHRGMLHVNVKDYRDPILYYSVSSTISGANTQQYIYKSNESSSSATSVDSTLEVDPRNSSSWSLRYRVVMKRPAVDGTNVYEGVASGYTSSKGVHVVSAQVQTVALEAYTTAPSFTIGLGAKGATVVGKIVNGVATTLNWDMTFDVIEQY